MHDKPMKKGKTLPPTERRETNKIHTTTSLYLRSGNNWAYSSPNGERGGRATIPSHLLSGLSRSKLTSEAKRNGCIVVGLSFTETTAIITFESYNSTSTFARFEAAAAGGTVSVSSADAGDKLLTGRFARASVAISIAVAIAIVGGTIINSGGIVSSSTIVSTSSSTARSRCRGELTSETESDSRIVVRLSVTEATAIITFESNNGTSTFARFEAAATGGTVSVSSANASDKLLTGRFARASVAIAIAVAIAIVGGTINSGGILSSSTIVGTSSSTARSRCRGELTSETESDSRIVVRLSVTKTTAIITFEGNNGTSTFTRFESTTARVAVGVGGARIGDEGPTGRQAHSTIDEEDSEDSEEFLHCFESI
jgi:ribosomal protein L18